MDKINAISARIEPFLPKHRDLYYDGKWRRSNGGYRDTWNPATGRCLGIAAEADAEDVDAAVKAAHEASREWRRIQPLERAELIRRVATVLRNHAEELAMIDAANCGNPVKEMLKDAVVAAMQIEYYAGLATEVKGVTIPALPLLYSGKEYQHYALTG